MGNVKKKQFLNELCLHLSDQSSKDILKSIKMIEALIVTHLSRGESVSFFNLGRFRICERKEKRYVNPKNNKEYYLPAHKTIAFKPSEYLKEEVSSF